MTLCSETFIMTRMNAYYTMSEVQKKSDLYANSIIMVVYEDHLFSYLLQKCHQNCSTYLRMCTRTHYD